MKNCCKAKEEAKKKIILSVIVSLICLAAAVPLIMVAGIFEMPTVVRVALIAVAIIVFAAGIAVACVLDRDAGTFECRKCGKRFIPDMKTYIMGPHTITTRYLKCPHCGESSYCKHKLSR